MPSRYSREVIVPFGVFLLVASVEGGGTSAGGTVLDPSSGADAFQVGQNTGQSFAAFEDDDRNGIEDQRR